MKENRDAYPKHQTAARPSSKSCQLLEEEHHRMFWLRLIYTRLYGLLRKSRIEQEMEEEMRFHLRMRTRENIERGMRPDEAERAARRRFGNMGHLKDLGRDIKGGGVMETLLQDLRY